MCSAMLISQAPSRLLASRTMVILRATTSATSLFKSTTSLEEGYEMLFRRRAIDPSSSLTLTPSHIVAYIHVRPR